ncbi:MAG: caspase family protein [Bacteroidota bacterium]
MNGRILLGVFTLVIISLSAFAQDDFTSYEEGIAKFKSKDYDGAIDIFSSILNKKDHSKRLDEDLYYYRGQSYFHKGEYRSSLSDLEQSLTLNNYNKGTIRWYMARCHDKLNNQQQAVDNYDEALKFSEKNKKLSAQILADRAEFNKSRGKSAEAQQDLAKAKELDPNNTAIAKIDPNNSGKVASRTAGEDKKTQIIVKNNQKQEATQPKKDVAVLPKKTETQEETQVPVQTQTKATSMIPALGEAYKDEKRYALIIGNSNYGKEIGVLKNPVNDATDVATELRNSNFEVQLLTNATYIQIREAVRKFHENLVNGPRDQTIGLFYYAGHGVQYQDENYLVPIDAKVQFEDDIVRMCFPVQRMVLANMERSNSRMNIVILDACRNNPFPATSRSVGSGLAEMKRARGSFIAYATAPGSVASDGAGRNGLYTQELLKALRKPGLTIEQVFKEVRMNVLRLSGEKQYTWDSSNIVGEFYFKFQ